MQLSTYSLLLLLLVGVHLCCCANWGVVSDAIVDNVASARDGPRSKSDRTKVSQSHSSEVLELIYKGRPINNSTAVKEFGGLSMVVHTGWKESLEKYHRRVRRDGWRKIGSGIQAKVYAHYKNNRHAETGGNSTTDEEGYALKVTRLLDRELAADPYLAFLWELYHAGAQGLPWFPQVGSVSFHIYDKPDPEDDHCIGFYVARVERLRRLRKPQRRMVKKLIDIILACTELDAPTRALVLSEPLLKTLNVLEVLFNDYDEDLHSDNIMLRGDQFVLIDPVWDREMRDLKRP